MIKIREMKLNDKGTTALVVAGVHARKTRRGSDYLALELFDGTDKINGNYWNWGGQNIPDVNAILDIDYIVTEYNGAKQLTVNSMRTNNLLSIDEFMPRQADYKDPKDLFEEALKFIDLMHDQYLFAICEHALKKYRALWLRAPGAKSVHHAFVGGTLAHSLSTAKIARNITMAMNIADIDLVTAGALLHDIGKLKTYELNGVVIDMTKNGMLFDHLYLGAVMLSEIAEEVCPFEDLNSKEQFKLTQLKHIIVSHHGEKEYGAISYPMSAEAHIVYHADTIDAEMQMLREASERSTGMWTDKLYFMHNIPHIRPQYVREMMSGKEDGFVE